MAWGRLGKLQVIPTQSRSVGIFRRISIPLHGVFIYGAFEGIMVSLFPVFLLHRGFQVRETGYALALFVVGGGIAMLPVSYFGDRLGKGVILGIVSGLGLGGVLGLGMASSVWMLMALSFVVGACLGPVFPMTLAMIGEILRPDELPSGSALFTSAFSYGCVVGPLVAAVSMSRWGDDFIFLAVDLLLVILLLRLFRKRPGAIEPLECMGEPS